jgi:hypothetical protein
MLQNDSKFWWMDMVALKDLSYGPRISLQSKNGKPPQLPQEVAHYLADMTLELRNMAKSAGLKTLQGLLEISYYEAFSNANPVVMPEGEIERLAEMSKAGAISEARR